MNKSEIEAAFAAAFGFDPESANSAHTDGRPGGLSDPNNAAMARHSEGDQSSQKMRLAAALSQRDFAQSRLVQAESRILELSLEIERLKAHIPSNVTPLKRQG